MIDKMLDRIEVMLLKLREDDPYKDALESEYNLYRKVLEALPRDVTPPDKLFSSVFSLEQRLNHYVILGKSNNPMTELSPSIHSRITSEEEKAALLALVNSNASYITNKKSKLTVLKSFLSRINYDGTLSDIASTIELVEKEYLESGVYSNEFEKEIAKAKYLYMIKLIVANEIDRADELSQSFSYDMVWVIYDRHHDAINKLLEEGRQTLAKALNDFITEFPKDREKDLEFWKVLAQIEHPDFEPYVEVIPAQENTALITQEDVTELTTKKRSGKLARFFNRKRMLVIRANLTNQDYIFEMDEEKAAITIWTFKGFEMDAKHLNNLVNLLQKAYSRNKTAFSNVTLDVKERSTTGILSESASFSRVISQITQYALLKKITIYGHEHFHEITANFLSGHYFESIEFHGGTWSFRDYAFSSCILLKKVDMSKIEVISFGNYIFNECTDLEEVMLPHTMDKYQIGEGMFCGCRSLTTVNWPNSADWIKDKTFMDCKSLRKISFGLLASIQRVGKSAFEGCESFEEFLSSDVETIDERAFYGCKALTSFSFARRSQVGDYAFAYTGLKKVDLDVLFRSTGVGVFMGSKIHSVNFSGELAVPEEMFKDCTELTSVSLESGMSLLGKGVFSGCVNLKRITGPSSFTYIGEECFMNCTSLKEINVSFACCVVGKRAFANCRNITSIAFPYIETVEKETFKGCTSLETIIFGDLQKYSVRVISDGAFDGCTRLRNFEFIDGLRVIGKKAFRGTDLVTLILPDSLVEIGNSAFEDCEYLKEVRIPPKVKMISDRLFKGCYNLKKVDMSNGDMMAIGVYAFAGCEALDEIHFGNYIRNIAENAFEDDDKITTLIVPTEAYHALRVPREDELLKQLGLKDLYIYQGSTETPDIHITTIGRNAYKEQ